MCRWWSFHWVRRVDSPGRSKFSGRTNNPLVFDSMDFVTRLEHDRIRSAETVLMGMASWNSLTALSYLQSDYQGLKQEEAAVRLKLTGHNVLSTTKPPTWWQLLLSVLPNSFNILLALLAIISVATPTPQWPTFVILIVMIVISVVVRFWQEYRSNVAAIKLQESVTSTVSVRRQIDDKVMVLTDEEKNLVPGDIVLLSPGDNVPADCLILESGNLQISQSR